MQIAYVAYEKLESPVKDKVDVLLRLNPDYGKWTAGITDPEDRQALRVCPCRDLGR